MTLRAKAEGRHPRPGATEGRNCPPTRGRWRTEVTAPRVPALLLEAAAAPPNSGPCLRVFPAAPASPVGQTVPGTAHEAERAQLGRPVANLTALGRGSSSQGGAGGGKGSFPVHREGSRVRAGGCRASGHLSSLLHRELRGSCRWPGLSPLRASAGRLPLLPFLCVFPPGKPETGPALTSGPWAGGLVWFWGIRGVAGALWPPSTPSPLPPLLPQSRTLLHTVL